MAPFARFSLPALLGVVFSCAAAPLVAQNARFDLTGPKVDIRVTRSGVSLPIAMVPNLLEGDQLWLHADLPSTQSVKYLLVAVFLRGTTNPPPEQWILRFETWDKHIKAEGAKVTVPAGAQQAVLLLAPETGGDTSTLRGAIRGRPGIFVRASQDLAEAGFEQARIEKYLDEIRKVPPGDSKALADHSELLARTLNLRPNADCFKRPVDQQYSCLTQTGLQSLLDDGHGQSIVNSLTSGASSDLITAASSTGLAGGGVYSAYVGAIVDVVRIMSNLHTAHYQYIPAISFPQNEALNLRLNVPPSFENPKSVIVVGLPAIHNATPPPLRASDAKQVTCLLKPDVALAVEGAPLVYSTDFTHDLVLHRDEPAHAPDLPLTPDAYQGGLVIHRPDPNARPALDENGHKVQSPSIAPPPPPSKDPAQAPAQGAPPSDRPAGKPGSGPSAAEFSTPPSNEPTATPTVEHTGTISGFWGFDHFTGPVLRVQDTPGTDWRLMASEDHVLAGETNHVSIASTGTGCIESITAQQGTSPEEPLKWSAGDKPNTVTVSLPLRSNDTGSVRIAVRQFGASAPDLLSLTAFSKPAELKSVSYHVGDHEAVLTGSNLRQVRRLEFSGLTFQRSAPSAGDEPSADESTLRLSLSNGQPSSKMKRGEAVQGQVFLADGRTLTVPFNLEGSRPVLSVLSKRAVPTDASSGIMLLNSNDVPLDSQLLLSLRASLPFPRDAQIEIASQDSAITDKLMLADGSLVLQDRTTVLAQVDLRKAFGSSAFGPVQIRMVLHDGTTSDWMPLATVVRLPSLTGLTCSGPNDPNCTLAGSKLFLLGAIAIDPAFAHGTEVPDGFVGATLALPHPTNGLIYLKLRDDPASVATITLQPTQP